MMRPVLRSALAAAVVAVLPVADSHGADWIETVPGVYGWDDQFGWNPSPPNGVGAIANFTSNINGAATDVLTVTVPGSMITLGTLNIGDSGGAPDSVFRVGNNGAGTIIFDNGGTDATINASKDLATLINSDDFIGANLQLVSNLVVNVTGAAGDHLRISGAIAGTGGLTKNGDGWLELSAQSGTSNTFTGLTVVNGGRLRLASGGGFTLIAGDIQINNGAVVQDSNGNGNVISDTSRIFITAGRYNPGTADDTVGAIAGTGGEFGADGSAVTVGGLNTNETFDGIVTSPGFSLIKVGTGSLTLGGTAANPASFAGGEGKFEVRGGRLELNKSDGVNAVGDLPLIISNGSGPAEVRLLNNNQIATATNSAITLNDQGVFNANGFSDALPALTVNGAADLDLGNGASVLSFANSSSSAWTGTLEVLNWSGSTSGAGTDQLFFGTDATGLTAAQLDAITFVNPAGAAAGSYDAKILASGEVVPVLTATRIPGDTNGDGTVDLADLNNVLNNFGATGTSPGDDDGNGVVDLADLNRVLNNFGDTAAASALSVVPEPSSLLAVCGLALPLLTKRRRNRH